MSGAVEAPSRRRRAFLTGVPLASALGAASVESSLGRTEFAVLILFACGAGLLAILAGLLWRIHGREVKRLRARVSNLESEVQRSRERLRSSLSGAAHDLSQPLTSLHGTLELALLANTVPTAARSALEEALQHTQTAMSLTRLLRELADAETNGAAAQATSVPGLLNEMREDLETLSRCHGVRLAMHGDTSAVVRANPPALRQSLFHLVEHALDRSPAGGLIEIIVARETGAASIVITNQGPPIPPQDLPRWFDPFYAGHCGANGKRNALRLAIVERISASCRGSVTAENAAGQGVRFVLRLPLA